MKPVNTNLCTHFLKGGPSVDDLPVRRFATNLNGSPTECIASYWQPSSQESEDIARGALIVFSSCGKTHPPISLDTTLMDPAQNADQFETDDMIIDRICAASFYTEGIIKEKPDLSPLKNITLQRMLDAAHRFRLHNEIAKEIGDESKSIQVIPSDRIIAAVYALINFDSNEDKIIMQHENINLCLLKSQTQKK